MFSSCQKNIIDIYFINNVKKQRLNYKEKNITENKRSLEFIHFFSPASISQKHDLINAAVL